MSHFKIPLILLVFIFYGCGTPESPAQWLDNNLHELKTPEGYDFSPIKKAIGDQRIVAIGESSHGLGEYYRVKSELVKYLHEEMGFEVIAMEGGLGDINLAYQDIDTLSATQLRDATVFGNFRATEADLLFQQIKESHASMNPLIFAGYDSQASSTYLTKALKPIVAKYNSKLADTLQQNLWSYGRAYAAGNQGDSLAYYKEQKIFLDTAYEIERILTQHETEIKREFDVSSFEFEVMVRSAQLFYRSYNHSYADRYLGGVVRDELMAENVSWLTDTVFAGKKIIVWAHNAHIEKAPIENGHPIKWMGHFLKEWYPEDYYALGLFTYEGTTYQHWDKSTNDFKNNDSTHIEMKMASSGSELAFLDLQHLNRTKATDWLFEPVSAYEVENGGIIKFIPTKRLDGMITVKKSDIPTYPPYK